MLLLIQKCPFNFFSFFIAIFRLHRFPSLGQHCLYNCFLDENRDSTPEIFENLFVGKKVFVALGIPEEPVHETSHVNVPRLAHEAFVHFRHGQFLVGTVKFANV
jgi:hypothetical protein